MYSGTVDAVTEYFTKKDRNHFQSIDEHVTKKNPCCYQKWFFTQTDHFYCFLFYRTSVIVALDLGGKLGLESKRCGKYVIKKWNLR